MSEFPQTPETDTNHESVYEQITVTWDRSLHISQPLHLLLLTAITRYVVPSDIALIHVLAESPPTCKASGISTKAAE